MSKIPTRQAAKVLGISLATLNRLIAEKKIPVPRLIEVGTVKVRLWSENEIERIRALLPKIKNGRKTRYEKKQLAIGSQQLVKSKAKPKKKPQPRVATATSTVHGVPGSSTVPHEQRSSKH